MPPNFADFAAHWNPPKRVCSLNMPWLYSEQTEINYRLTAFEILFVLFINCRTFFSYNFILLVLVHNFRFFLLTSFFFIVHKLLVSGFIKIICFWPLFWPIALFVTYLLLPPKQHVFDRFDSEAVKCQITIFNFFLYIHLIFFLSK